MIKSVIFDLDGTLTNTLQDIAEATNYGLEKMGYEIHPTKKYADMIGSGVRWLCVRALPGEREEYEEEVNKLLDLYFEFHNVHFMDNTILYDGIKEMLLKLSKMGLELGILTNKPDHFTQPLVKKLMSDVPFKFVMGNSDKLPIKPSKEAINYVLDKMDTTAKESVYIGDSDVDVLTAKNGGIENMIGVKWGFRGVEELKNAGAKFIANTPSDIVDIIEKLNK